MNRLVTARKFAIDKHRHKKYGMLPYAKHLHDVDNALVRFGFGDDIELRMAAWLHDVIEDTDTSKEELLYAFGVRVASLVDSVTDGDGTNRKERKAIMYQKLLLFPAGIPLKLADRIGNFEWSLLTSKDKLKMYMKEAPGFEDALRSHSSDLVMWEHLDYLYKLGLTAITGR